MSLTQPPPKTSVTHSTGKYSGGIDWGNNGVRPRFGMTPLSSVDGSDMKRPHKLKLERAKLVMRQKRNWQSKFLQEGSSGSKTLCKSLEVPPTPLQAVKSGNTVIADPAQITKLIFKHFHSLTNQPTSETNVTYPSTTTMDPDLDTLIPGVRVVTRIPSGEQKWQDNRRQHIHPQHNHETTATLRHKIIHRLH